MTEEELAEAQQDAIKQIEQNLYVICICMFVSGVNV